MCLKWMLSVEMLRVFCVSLYCEIFNHSNNCMNHFLFRFDFVKSFVVVFVLFCFFKTFDHKVSALFVFCRVYKIYISC